MLPDTDDFLVLRPIGGIDDDIAGVLLREGVRPTAFPAATRRPRRPPQRHPAAQCPADRFPFHRRPVSQPGVDRRQNRAPATGSTLMMALRQDGAAADRRRRRRIGKTIEAGLVATELLKVGDARGLAVLCSPALAEQWQSELRGKSSGWKPNWCCPARCGGWNAAGSRASRSIFGRYPVTVVTTDFIKNARRRYEFLRTCPDLVIVDFSSCLHLCDVRQHGECGCVHLDGAVHDTR